MTDLSDDLKKIKSIILGLECPICGSKSVINENGILICQTCGYKWKEIGD